MSDFPPTDEQMEILTAFHTGDDLVIQAAAGAGKTSTLVLIAENMHVPRPKSGLYIAYNKAIADEANDSFRNLGVTAKTAHSLAYGETGIYYKQRLNRGAPAFPLTMKIMGITSGITVAQSNGDTLKLTAGNLVSMVNDTIGNFCYSAASEVARTHVPRLPGKVDFATRARVTEIVHTAAERAWKDLIIPDTEVNADENRGILKFSHDHYLKIWICGGPSVPKLGYDVIFFDEAQDANPVLSYLLSAQDHAQRIVVGDSAQQIYAWRGAVDALDSFPGTQLTLSESFRFGPEIAEVANYYLDDLDAPIRITGRGKPGTVGPHTADPDAILCRTNAGVLETLLEFMALPYNQRPLIHVVGGVSSYQTFFDAAVKLQGGQTVNLPELRGFADWDAVLHYAKDEDGTADKDVVKLVRLVEKFGAPELAKALRSTVSAEDADVLLSTAHKAKGKQWGHVRIHVDFESIRKLDEDGNKEPLSPADLRLRYVAVTRAMTHLDPGPLLTA